MRTAKPSYATAASTRRAVNAFIGCGLQVGSVRLLPDGTIEIAASGMSPPNTRADNDFDKLDAAGLL